MLALTTPWRIVWTGLLLGVLVVFWFFMVLLFIALVVNKEGGGDAPASGRVGRGSYYFQSASTALQNGRA
jgi:hypothetical protein